MLHQALLQLIRPAPLRYTVGSLKLPNMERLILAQDFLHTYRVGSFGVPPLSCRVRIYTAPPHQPESTLVLYSAMGIGSITNWTENIASLMWQRLKQPGDVYFVEHWSPNPWTRCEFTLVQFQALYEWLIYPEWAEIRRAEIEAVVQGPIEALQG